MKLLEKNSGQLMLEVLFALSVVSLTLLALTTATVVSLKNIRYAKNMTLANHYAREAQEVLRRERDSRSWDEFTLKFQGDMCLDDNLDWSDSCQCHIPTKNVKNFFYRCVKFSSNKKVAILVSWTDSNCASGSFCHKAETTTILSEWSK